MSRRRRGSQNPLVAEVAELRAQIAELRDQAIRYVEAPVTAADSTSSTFTVAIDGQVNGQDVPLSGVSSGSQFLPAVGDTVQLSVAGAQPIYLASSIAENAITGREIAPASVDEGMLTFNISDVGGTKIWYGSTTPTAGAIGELWVKTLGLVNGVQQHETRRWNGTSWALLADQSVTQALLDAADAQTTADSKSAQFSGPTAPTTGMVIGDEWIDTANGNRVNIYGTTGSVLRRNIAKNPSFEYDAPATLTGSMSASDYTRFSTGSPGTLTHSIQASGGTQGSRYYKVVGSSMGPSAEMGIISVRGISPGDTAKVSADMWVTVASTTKPVQMYVDILSSTFAVLTSTRITGTGSTGTQRLTTGLLTAPAGAVSIRVWLMRASSSTGANGLPVSSVTTTNADVNFDGLLVELNPPTGAPTTYFDGTTTGGTWEGTPHLSPSQVSQESTVALGWQPRPVRTGAIEPKSLVAKDVVATGTVSAALLEAIMVLASIIIAGNSAGNHARLTDTGLRVYRLDPTDNSLDQIGHFGSPDGNFAGGGLDASGNQAWSIDDTGQASFRKTNSREDPIFMGESFSTWMKRASGAGNGAGSTSVLAGAEHYAGWANGSISTVSTETGLIELDVYVSNSRTYWIGPSVSYARGTDTELVLRIRDGGTSAPVLTSPEIYYRQFSNSQPFYDASAFEMGIWQPTVTGVHRLLLTANRQGTGVVDIRTVNCLPGITVVDLGPKKSVIAGVSRGVSGAAPPAQQLYTELSPTGWASYRGDGTLHPSSSTDVVQGWDPVGTNGDCRGHWWFTLPSITGTVDRIQLYVVTPYWYYNSGGTAIYNLTSASSATFAPTKLRSDFPVGPYPKAGAATIDLPSDWLPYFVNSSSPRAAGITVGPSGGTDLTYTGRFTGAATRLRIWYTQ